MTVCSERYCPWWGTLSLVRGSPDERPGYCSPCWLQAPSDSPVLSLHTWLRDSLMYHLYWRVHGADSPALKQQVTSLMTNIKDRIRRDVEKRQLKTRGTSVGHFVLTQAAYSQILHLSYGFQILSNVENPLTFPRCLMRLHSKNLNNPNLSLSVSYYWSLFYKFNTVYVVPRKYFWNIHRMLSVF